MRLKPEKKLAALNWNFQRQGWHSYKLHQARCLCRHWAGPHDHSYPFDFSSVSLLLCHYLTILQLLHCTLLFVQSNLSLCPSQDKDMPECLPFVPGNLRSSARKITFSYADSVLAFFQQNWPAYCCPSSSNAPAMQYQSLSMSISCRPICSLYVLFENWSTTSTFNLLSVALISISLVSKVQQCLNFRFTKQIHEIKRE